MRKIQGDMTLMSLPDLMQWIDLNQKTGTLTLRSRNIVRVIYVQNGKLLFVSSSAEGNRLGEFLVSSRIITKEQLAKALSQSHKLNIPFTGYIVSEKYVSQKKLKDVLTKFAEAVVTNALKWPAGIFEFRDTIPPAIANGPVKLAVSLLVFQSVKVLDESEKDSKADFDKIVRKIAKRIKNGDVEMPPLPDILSKINEAQNRDAPAGEIVKLIMTDQILTAKILKVVNSSFYSPPSKVTSVQHAIVYMGSKSIISIVTAHVLSGISSKDSNKVKEIMRHSLLCAFISKKLAVKTRSDAEEVFVCGLLHDIGKTALVNLVSDYKLTEEEKEILFQKYHQQVGHAMITKWKLSGMVGEVAMYHHRPQKATDYKEIVEAICIADILANDPDNLDAIPKDLSSIDVNQIDFEEIREETASLKDTVDSVI